jgi:hypothetical protein
MGIFDMMIVFVAGDQCLIARTLGQRQCGGGLQLKVAMMAQAITKYFWEHPEFQKASSFVAFKRKFLLKNCARA